MGAGVTKGRSSARELSDNQMCLQNFSSGRMIALWQKAKVRSSCLETA